MTGGGTEFASTYAAYENLPEQERKRYDDLRVVPGSEAARQQRLIEPNPTGRATCILGAIYHP